MPTLGANCPKSYHSDIGKKQENRFSLPHANLGLSPDLRTVSTQYEQRRTSDQHHHDVA